MAESKQDARAFNLFNKKSSGPELIKVKFNPNALYYDMEKNKYLHIFNHYEFEDTEDFDDKPEKRDGTEADVERLHQVFEPLGFKVKTYNDLKYAEIIKTLSGIIDEDHINKTSCICIAILTHGGRDGELYAKDRPYSLRVLTELFENKKLVTIPKLFFVQACRVDKVEDGNYIECDGARQILHLPSHIDFLIMRSAVEGYSSFREECGTWMIQALCDVIELYHNECDILIMITFVNHLVAHEYRSYNKKIPEIHMKKQTVETCFTLTKLLKL